MGSLVELNVDKVPAEELARQMIADGYSEQEAREVIGRKKKSGIKTNIAITATGLGFFFLGLLLSIGSYRSASSGGTYYLFFGAVIVGILALAKPWADVVLSGAAAREQLASNLAAEEAILTENELERLSGLAESPEEYWGKRSAQPWN